MIRIMIRIGIMMVDIGVWDKRTSTNQQRNPRKLASLAPLPAIREYRFPVRSGHELESKLVRFLLHFLCWFSAHAF